MFSFYYLELYVLGIYYVVIIVIDEYVCMNIEEFKKIGI